MVASQQKNVVPQEERKYNIKRRYERLNNHQKLILQEQFQTTFQRSQSNFYYTLKGDNLSVDELFFFAGSFDCRIQDLLTKPIVKAESVKELERKQEGNTSKQAVIDI
ncbi:hypothetical protein HUW51_16970 [Adhaeribacter swui]|uniref:Uncharacterized protein n=1 Tax=Adhaeribacter swui TaxID=2086471 RepID=A0A7G7GAZ7_9BACT|nr:hypothetical protein [Adhaeribacter swui]QNF34331.1 hypothetical protein HUW51_16970 [Adhaeribacter swui]